MPGSWSWVPSFDDAVKEASILTSSISSVTDRVPDGGGAVDPVAKDKDKDNSLLEQASSVLHNVSSHMGDLASAGSLLEKTASELTTVDVRAGGKVDVNGTLTTKNTVTFALDRYSMLYAGLAIFAAMEAYNLLNR